MLRLKVNSIYTKSRIYNAIEDIIRVSSETNCIRNEHTNLYREFENEDVNIDDAIVKYGRIDKENLNESDRGVSSQRLDLFLKKDLNKELNDIYGEQEAILSVKGDDDKWGYQPASNISVAWQYSEENRRYWDTKLITRHLDERLFSDLDYNLLSSDGRPTYFDNEPPEIIKEFCKNLSLIINRHEFRKL